MDCFLEGKIIMNVGGYTKFLIGCCYTIKKGKNKDYGEIQYKIIEIKHEFTKLENTIMTRGSDNGIIFTNQVKIDGGFYNNQGQRKGNRLSWMKDFKFKNKSFIMVNIIKKGQRLVNGILAIVYIMSRNINQCVNILRVVDQLIKIGKWIELWEGFQSMAQVISNSLQNFKCMKIGQWDINYCDPDDRNGYKQMQVNILIYNFSISPITLLEFIMIKNKIQIHKFLMDNNTSDQFLDSLRKQHQFCYQLNLFFQHFCNLRVQISIQQSLLIDYQFSTMWESNSTLFYIYIKVRLYYFSISG
ncbi:unnamed protein product [Paramecium sonneborni]|uniref:Uncharacterized protein n=1 Tax=Paramecium sonneborni TaxID=65129 RepID=A0A8S1RNN7_9CILI|nr:unnamed protein product [Paramecium sonneborni]